MSRTAIVLTEPLMFERRVFQEKGRAAYRVPYIYVGLPLSGMGTYRCGDTNRYNRDCEGKPDSYHSTPYSLEAASLTQPSQAGWPACKP